MTIPFKPLVPDPDLSTFFSLFKKDVMLSLNCHAIATVQSFDSDKQTVVATVNYTKSFFERDAATGQFNQIERNYPLLLDVPIIILAGGPASLTMPIAKGDQCLVLFNDRDIDNWFSGANSGPVNSARLHDLSDGIALIGLRNNPMSDYDPDRAVIQNGTTKVAIGETLIELSNNLYTLNELLQELVDDIKDLVTQTAAITVSGVTSGGSPSGPPVNAAAIAAISTQLSATADKIGDLLE